MAGAKEREDDHDPFPATGISPYEKFIDTRPAFLL